MRAAGLGKRYRYGLVGNSHPTLRDSLAAAGSRLTKWGTRAGRRAVACQASARPSTFWALRDVSFDVEHGEVVGIVGRNGAGKSTLLKILSRVTEPTEGYAEVHGRVGSLLEVGTGFHPELTGRENVFLNGAILGMRRAEISRKFDEIVAFAEVAPFIDTPVKFYSSGMYLRLAFAVAAHLEPEILVVDEVLAVGDAAFQSKCLGKMGDVAREGRTVLFVSHNMAAVQKLCGRAVLIRGGLAVADGPVKNVVATYLEILERNASSDLVAHTERHGEGRVRIVRFEAFVSDSGPAQTLMTGWPARLVFHVDAVQPKMSCSFAIFDQLGQPVTYFDSAEHGQQDLTSLEHGAAFRCEIDELLLVPGRYRIDVGVSCNHIEQDVIFGAAFIDVEQGLLRGRPVARNSADGSVIIPHRWIKPGQAS